MRLELTLCQCFQGFLGHQNPGITTLATALCDSREEIETGPRVYRTEVQEGREVVEQTGKEDAKLKTSCSGDRCTETFCSADDADVEDREDMRDVVALSRRSRGPASVRHDGGGRSNARTSSIDRAMGRLSCPAQ